MQVVDRETKEVSFKDVVCDSDDCNKVSRAWVRAWVRAWGRVVRVVHVVRVVRACVPCASCVLARTCEHRRVPPLPQLPAAALLPPWFGHHLRSWRAWTLTLSSFYYLFDFFSLLPSRTLSDPPPCPPSPLARQADTTLEGLASLAPIMAEKNPKATVTAGNASQLSDGGSACLVMEAAEAQKRGTTALGIFKVMCACACVWVRACVRVCALACV